MIHLHFQDVSKVGSITLGPAPWFRVAGNFIRQGPQGEIVAIYRHHHWEVKGKFFTRFDCHEGMTIHFEDTAGGPTEAFGPFSAFFTADGVLYTDNTLFAKFMEETQLWHCYDTENFWPAMVIVPISKS